MTFKCSLVHAIIESLIFKSVAVSNDQRGNNQDYKTPSLLPFTYTLILLKLGLIISFSTFLDSVFVVGTMNGFLAFNNPHPLFPQAHSGSFKERS